MNKNQKIIAIVVSIILVAGFCYYVIKVHKNGKDIKNNKKAIKKVEEKLSEQAQKNPSASIPYTFGQLTKNNKELFNDQSIRVYGAKIREGGEASLREIAKDVKDEKESIRPESISDFIETPIEAISSNEDKLEIEIEPSQNSDQVLPPKETSTQKLANEEEMRKKIPSCLGQKELENDLWKFHAKNSKGEYILEFEEVKELILNICYYCPDKPTGKMFSAKIERVYTLPYLMFQIYNKHKFNNNTALKFAQILVDNITQYKDKTAKSIVKNWGKPGNGKLRSELESNPYIILI